MRRWLTTVALGGVAALALAGCGAPTGVDGDLVDDWAAVSEPKPFVPEVGTCHLNSSDVGFLSSYNPVDCGQAHQVEIMHVGTLSGELADRQTPPPIGSPATRAARGECDREVNKALGADWRTARLGLSVVFPSPPAWSGGARWFRCDLSEVKSIDDPSLNSRTGSLVGALKAASPLAHACFNPKVVSDDIDEMRAVACTAKHRAEFVGVYLAPDTSYASFSKSSKTTHRNCIRLIAAYAKVPNNSDMNYRAGSIFYHPFEDEWRNGNRGVQCFLWISDRDLTRSMKGAGTRGLPVR